VRSIKGDCDDDALLIQASPAGPTCHTGKTSCFDASFSLDALDEVVAERFRKKPKGSYITSLIRAGLDRMAQKVGEEAVETVIAAQRTSAKDFENEAADLLFHLMVLLRARKSNIARIIEVLRKRHASSDTKRR
jgi:phosphoribosyl-ATP pyrophosphohydrolase/phosphoribosyl-AMP cyclohydrolase